MTAHSPRQRAAKRGGALVAVAYSRWMLLCSDACSSQIINSTRRISAAPDIVPTHLLVAAQAEGIGPDLARQARQRPALRVLAWIKSTLEGDQMGMAWAQRFATPHAGKLSQRFAVLGRTLTLPRRDTHRDLPITEHVTGKPRYSGRPPHDAVDGTDVTDSRAGWCARFVDAPRSP
jgi:hypothetical protein